MTAPHDDTAVAFDEAVEWFLAVLRAVEDDQWDAPGLGEWTVRELAAHTGRAAVTFSEYLDPEGGAIEIPSTTEYYRRALAAPGINAAVATRAREDAARHGDDLVAAMTTACDSARAALAACPDGAVCRTRAGVMAVDDFLATRVVELVLHTLDLARATGRADQVPPRAGRLVLAQLTALVADDELAVVLRALSGRDQLGPGYSIFVAGG